MGDQAYIGEISMFAGNYAPDGWHFCDGSLLSIRGYEALYSILGIYYGGDGTTNFALPDLRGRMPVGFGAGPNLTPRDLGTKAGAEKLTLTTANTPVHAHAIKPSKTAVKATLFALNDSANLPSPEEAYIATPTTNLFREAGSSIPMASGSITVDASGINTTEPAGQAAPIESMPPFQAINFIICCFGIYPPRP